MKYSKQRQIIKNQIMDRKDHPTASIIYEELRKKDINLSIATVYRNLNLLVENGEVKKIELDGEDRFDPNTYEHGHFICECCEEVQDIEIEKDLIELMKKVSLKITGSIRTYNFTIKGICNKCKEKKC